MKIQKGIVKYKDRNDIVCTYGVTDDGKQFYFLDETDEKKFANGNRIASTELVEAIDPMVKASHIGIVGANGNEVVPFIYKSIRPVNDSIVLVELSKPTSPSVLEAISLKSDPLSAAKLVSTPAAIKEKLNAKMGADGRYLFNDQFSEVTVCDIDGNNLIENQLFSFAGVANDTLYLSKNTIDSDIVEFSILPPEDETVENNEINVTDVNVPSGIVDKAMVEASSSGVSDIPPIVTEDAPVVEENVESVAEEIPSVAVDEVIPPVAEEAPVDNSTEVNSDDLQVVPDEVGETIPTNEEVIENVSEEIPVTEEVVESVSEKAPTAEENVENGLEEAQYDEIPAPEMDEVVVDNISVSEDEKDLTSDVDLDLSEDSSFDEDEIDDFTTSSDDDDDENVEIGIGFTEPTAASLSSVEDSLSDNGNVNSAIPDLNINFDDNSINTDTNNSSENVETVEPNNKDENLLDSDEFNDDLFGNDNYKIDKIENDDYFNDNFDNSYNSSKITVGSDSIMNDVAKSLTSLMKQNRNQKNIISEYKDKIDKLSASRRNIVEKAKIQEQKLEALNNKNRNFETTISKLEAKLQMLEGRIRDQDKLIAYQSKELESIKPQKDDLAKLVADAQALLGDDVNGSYPF